MTIQRGEIYFVDLGGTVGREQRGVRPVVVMSNDIINNLPLVVAIVPGTKGSNVYRDFPQNVRVPVGEANLPDETVFLTFQVRALDQSRFTTPASGCVSAAVLMELEASLAYSFALPSGAGPVTIP